MLRYGLITFLALCLFACGYYLGLTEQEKIFSEVKWTDIGMLVVTMFGFSFGFITYFQWLNNKREDDAYLAAKNYVAAVDEVQEHLHELLAEYAHRCGEQDGSEQLPGLALDNSFSHLASLWQYFYQSRRSLHKAHRELAFWNVSLTSEFAADYQQIKQLLAEASSLCGRLNSKLAQPEPDNREQLALKQRLDVIYQQINGHNHKRVEKGFKAIFRFF